MTKIQSKPHKLLHIPSYSSQCLPCVKGEKNKTSKQISNSNDAISFESDNESEVATSKSFNKTSSSNSRGSWLTSLLRKKTHSLKKRDDNSCFTSSEEEQEKYAEMSLEELQGKIALLKKGIEDITEGKLPSSLNLKTLRTFLENYLTENSTENAPKNKHHMLNLLSCLNKTNLSASELDEDSEGTIFLNEPRNKDAKEFLEKFEQEKKTTINPSAIDDYLTLYKGCQELLVINKDLLMKKAFPQANNITDVAETILREEDTYNLFIELNQEALLEKIKPNDSEDKIKTEISEFLEKNNDDAIKFYTIKSDLETLPQEIEKLPKEAFPEIQKDLFGRPNTKDNIIADIILTIQKDPNFLDVFDNITHNHNMSEFSDIKHKKINFEDDEKMEAFFHLKLQGYESSEGQFQLLHANKAFFEAIKEFQTTGRYRDISSSSPSYPTSPHSDRSEEEIASTSSSPQPHDVSSEILEYDLREYNSDINTIIRKENLTRKEVELKETEKEIQVLEEEISKVKESSNVAPSLSTPAPEITQALEKSPSQNMPPQSISPQQTLEERVGILRSKKPDASSSLKNKKKSDRSEEEIASTSSSPQPHDVSSEILEYNSDIKSIIRKANLTRKEVELKETEKEIQVLEEEISKVKESSNVAPSLSTPAPEITQALEKSPSQDMPPQSISPQQTLEERVGILRSKKPDASSSLKNKKKVAFADDLLLSPSQDMPQTINTQNALIKIQEYRNDNFPESLSPEEIVLHIKGDNNKKNILLSLYHKENPNTHLSEAEIIQNIIHNPEKYPDINLKFYATLSHINQAEALKNPKRLAKIKQLANGSYENISEKTIKIYQNLLQSSNDMDLFNEEDFHKRLNFLDTPQSIEIYINNIYNLQTAEAPRDIFPKDNGRSSEQESASTIPTEETAKSYPIQDSLTSHSLPIVDSKEHQTPEEALETAVSQPLKRKEKSKSLPTKLSQSGNISHSTLMGKLKQRFSFKKSQHNPLPLLEPSNYISEEGVLTKTPSSKKTFGWGSFEENNLELVSSQESLFRKTKSLPSTTLKNEPRTLRHSQSFSSFIPSHHINEKEAMSESPDLSPALSTHINESPDLSPPLSSHIRSQATQTIIAIKTMWDELLFPPLVSPTSEEDIIKREETDSKLSPSKEREKYFNDLENQEKIREIFQIDSEENARPQAIESLNSEASEQNPKKILIHQYKNIFPKIVSVDDIAQHIMRDSNLKKTFTKTCKKNELKTPFSKKWSTLNCGKNDISSDEYESFIKDALIHNKNNITDDFYKKIIEKNMTALIKEYKPKVFPYYKNLENVINQKSFIKNSLLFLYKKNFQNQLNFDTFEHDDEIIKKIINKPDEHLQIIAKCYIAHFIFKKLKLLKNNEKFQLFQHVRNNDIDTEETPQIKKMQKIYQSLMKAIEDEANHSHNPEDTRQNYDRLLNSFQSSEDVSQHVKTIYTKTRNALQNNLPTTSKNNIKEDYLEEANMLTDSQNDLPTTLKNNIKEDYLEEANMLTDSQNDLPTTLKNNIKEDYLAEKALEYISHITKIYPNLLPENTIEIFKNSDEKLKKEIETLVKECQPDRLHASFSRKLQDVLKNSVQVKDKGKMPMIEQ